MLLLIRHEPIVRQDPEVLAGAVLWKNEPMIRETVKLHKIQLRYGKLRSRLAGEALEFEVEYLAYCDF